MSGVLSDEKQMHLSHVILQSLEGTTEGACRGVLHARTTGDQAGAGRAYSIGEECR